MDSLTAVLRVDSPLRSISGLTPKVVYDDWGVFYDPVKGIFVKAEIVKTTSDEHGCCVLRLDEITQIVPVAVVFPGKDGEYGMDEDELFSFVECDFCGEADDLSCYLYFNKC